MLKSTTVIAFAVLSVAFVQQANARGGGITGFQGAGAAIGGGPIGGNQRPAYSSGNGRYEGFGWFGPDVSYSDGPNCYLQRSPYGSPGFQRICD